MSAVVVITITTTGFGITVGAHGSLCGADCQEEQGAAEKKIKSLHD